MNFEDIKKIKSSSYFVLLIFLLSGIGIYVYFNFLTFKKLLMYYDTGCDSFFQFWPDLANLHRNFPGWSFNIGLGQNAFQSWLFDPFLLCIHFFSKNEFVLVLPYLILFKILFAGILFYLYLRVLSMSEYASIFGAISYAFCGQMILFSGWTYFYGTAYVVIAFLLLSVEMFIKRNNWFFLPLAVACMPIVQSFYVWPFSILLFLYAIFRYTCENRFDFRKMARFFVKFCGAYMLGFMISAFLFLPEFWIMLQSSRVSGKEQLFSSFRTWGLTRLNSPAEIFSSLLRVYSSDIIGIGDCFKGWCNYMEAPVYYCGLPALLLMPQAFKFIRLKLKILFSLLLLSVLVYICFAYPRLILFGFFGCYYRIAANFVTISLLFISVHALHFIHKEFKVDTGLLLMTLLALITPIATSVIVLKFCDNYILDSGIIISIICFLLIYCVIIRLLAIKKTRFFAMVLFFLALSFELALFSYTTVNKRFALRSDYIKSKTGYFDYTNDAIAYLNSVDKDFYRIIRGYDSVQHADALFQNWKGTKAYGQWNHKPVRDFLIDMDVEQEIKSVSWICGFGLRYKLDTLMGVKYLLVKDKHSIPNGFEFIENIDDIYIYKNKLYLPLGFTYNTFVKYEDFMDFPLELKDNALLTAFVWQGGSDILTEYGIKKKILPGNFEYNHDNAINTLKRNALNIISYNHSSIQGNITLDEDGLLFLSIPFDRGWKLKVDGIFANMHKVNIGFIGILLKKGFHKVDLRYFVPFLDIGIIISCVGLFIYLLLVIRQRKSDQCTSS